MKYLSIDIETTGLDPETCQILSFATVIEDTDHPEIPVEELPGIHLIMNLKTITGEPYALNLNKDIIEIIKEGKDERLVYPGNFNLKIRDFLNKNGIFGRLQVAGKNFGTFDKLFIEKLSKEMWGDTLEFNHRILDVGPLFVDFKNDEWLPNLDTCMERAGVEGVVTHDALQDAIDVIRVLRTKY